MSRSDAAAPRPSDETVSSRRLAQLARTGFSLVRQPIMRVAYEVHHVTDRSGYLYDVLTREGGKRFIETLTTAAYGTGLVIGTKAVSPGLDNLLLPETADRVEASDAGEARVFRGNAIPNVSFDYDSSRVFEGLIAIDQVHASLQQRHSQAILDVMAEVTELATTIAEAPILSLQSPVQLPTPEYAARVVEEDVRPNATTARAWPAPTALAVRFAIALSESTTAKRLRLVDELACFCSDRGFAFWVNDIRSGFRAGNWFQICERNTEKLDILLDSCTGTGQSDPPQWSLPITFVGPARVGAVRSFVNYLRCYPGIGVICCSMSIIDDVTFMHAHLTTDAIQDEEFAQTNRMLEYLTSAPDGQTPPLVDPQSLLPKVLNLLTSGQAGPSPKAAGDLAKRLRNFHLLVGPQATKIIADQANMRRALWVSWEVEGSEADLGVPFGRLYDVLTELVKRLDIKEAPNVEYLICRRVRRVILRGKGKISFPEQISTYVDDHDRGRTRTGISLSSLCERIEEAWRSKLDPSHPVRELTVSWRENWLGHWTSPLD